MRNYDNFDIYLNRLQGDIYPQPPDPLQQEYGEWIITNWVSQLWGCKTVLDVGCGQGQFYDAFTKLGIVWTGVTLGEDYHIVKNKGLTVYQDDFTFLDRFDDNAFDLVFARHSLEHSPFPLLTLMEWRRVSKQSLCVVIPVPDFHGERGKNHYSVMSREQFIWLSNRAGWKLLWENDNNFEYRFMLQKSREIGE